MYWEGEFIANLGSSNDNINIDGSITEFTDFGGTDTYTILPTLSGDVTITDVQKSRILLPEGMSITDAWFLSDGVQFEVNGFVVTFIGTPQLSQFVFGGTPLDANAGTALNFDDTAAAFGTSVPAQGEPPNEATQTGEINADGSVGEVGFDLPSDPGLNSPDGIFFENVFFTTDTGTSSDTPQGLLELETNGDIFAATGTPSSFVVKNAELTVGDDFQISDGDSVFSLTGPSTLVTLPGTEFSGSSQLRVSTSDGRSTTGTFFINDGAQVIVDHFDPDSRGSIEIARNSGPEIENDVLLPGGQSVVGNLVIEGAQTTVSVINSGGGERGSLTIANISSGEDGVTDTTQNRTADGLVIIRDGAEVNVRNFVSIADADNVAGAVANGTLIVEGNGTLFTAGLATNEGRSGGINVAEEGGNGELILRDGAEMRLFAGDEFGAFLDLSSGSDENGTATALFTGVGTSLLVEEGGIFVGHRSGQAEFTVSDGATVFAGDIIAAEDGTASITIEGAGTNVTLGGESGVGRDGFLRIAEDGGTGSLVLRDGAQLDLLSGEEFGAGIQLSGRSDRIGGTATFDVTGSGTELLVEDGYIEVGRNVGTATLTVSNGASVTAEGINTAINSTGTTTITGQGTIVTLSYGEQGGMGIAEIRGQDVVGDGDPVAEGTVTISDGASVSLRQSIIIGDANNVEGATADGTLIVEGLGTMVTLGSASGVGDNGFMRVAEEGGTGSFILRDGAQIHLLAGEEFGGGMQLSGGSDRDGGTASAEITGEGTLLVAGKGSIEVGRNVGSSTFTVSDGADVEANFFSSGRDGMAATVFEGEGTTLSLAGSTVSNEFGAFLDVARNAEGSILVGDGADITITGDGGDFPGFQVGRNDGGVGTLTVTGAGSTISIDGADNIDIDGGETGFIRAGAEAGSSGTINVLDGGIITNDPDGIFILAENDGSEGILNVDGSGSVFDFGADASLSEDSPGARGNAIVTVSNGGTLEGDEIVNNGILDVTSGGQLNADVIQDNILRSSSGIEDLTINGDLTVNTGGFGFDFLVSGGVLIEHDTYSASGDVVLDGILYVLASSITNLDGFTADLVTGSSITVNSGFSVQLVEFDANSLTEVDSAALTAAASNSIELGFATDGTTLTVDFSGAGSLNSATQIVGSSLAPVQEAIF
ncbi:beta strand repeat-containing protein [Marivita hallyeonensis]|uniref:T5SS/PEP-CTERM-associated repeat-containing protein n=1 Tax=Marivita hallyeonensis TaxID=996342 RepID=A0A1M5VMA0_9RHOB|nr:hypothetical protein [Marivita hallyeonensis]SHH76369.1 T5SS/PEP-CTERM-associated repeat-containing protein [Marivita hallyeonensis]